MQRNRRLPLTYQASHIPSQRRGFVGLLQDWIQISSLQKPTKPLDPPLDVREEAQASELARTGDRNAKQRLVDHYDTLAGNALLRADAAKNEQDRQDCWRQWCFYSARAEELDTPSRREEIRQAEREFYRRYPPKEAKILTTTVVKTRPHVRMAKTIGGLAWCAGWAALYGPAFLSGEYWESFRKITEWWMQLLHLAGPPLFLIMGIGMVREGLSKKANIKTRDIHECSNCGHRLTSAYTSPCPSCHVKLTR